MDGDLGLGIVRRGPILVLSETCGTTTQCMLYITVVGSARFTRATADFWTREAVSPTNVFTKHARTRVRRFVPFKTLHQNSAAETLLGGGTRGESNAARLV